MRILALILGTAAALGFAASAGADPGTDRFQIAQAQESGAQGGAGMGAGQRGGEREGGAAFGRGSRVGARRQPHNRRRPRGER
jgi:hypothetical protein